MKRINRKKIIETLEIARQGYSSLTIIARDYKDKIMEMACKAHHEQLNRQIIELGGDSYDPPLMDKKSRACTQDIIDEAMKIVNKDVRSPKCVRDGIVKPHKKK